MPLGVWPEVPPLGEMQPSGDIEVSVSSIFDHIASIAGATVPPKPASKTPPAHTPSDSNEESDSSEWESDATSEEGMGEPLELDADMGDATFATS